MALAERWERIVHEVEPVLADVDPESFAAAVAWLGRPGRLFVAGAGRSGLLLRMFAMRMMQAGFCVHAAGEATTPAAEPGDRLLILSGSGATSTMQAVAGRADAVGAKRMLMTYRADSPLATGAELVLALPVPLDPKRPGGLAGTQLLGSLFDQTAFVVLEALVHEITGTAGIEPARLARRHANLE